MSKSKSRSRSQSRTKNMAPAPAKKGGSGRLRQPCFFACQKDAAGAEAALKKAASANKKIGSGSTLKVAAPAPQHCIWLSI